MGGTTSTTDRLELGSLTLSLDVAFARAEASHAVDPSQHEPHLDVGDQPASHTVVSWMNGFQLGASFGLGNRVGLDLALPFRVSVLEATFTDHHNAELDIDSIHHHDETVAGIGDLELGARFGLVRPMDVRGLTLDLRIGLSFPTGHVEPDPYALGDQGQWHRHTFFGQGTFVPQVGLDLDFATPGGSVTLSADGQISFYEGPGGYEPPSFGTFGLGFRSGFGLETVRFTIAQILYSESESFWAGTAAENSGRTDLAVDLRVGADLGAGLSLGALIRATYFSATNGGTFESPFLLGLSLGWTIDTLPD